MTIRLISPIKFVITIFAKSMYQVNTEKISNKFEYTKDCYQIKYNITFISFAFIGKKLLVLYNCWFSPLFIKIMFD